MKLELYVENPLKSLNNYMKYVKETLEIKYAFEPLDPLTVNSIRDYLNWKLSIDESKIIKNYTISWFADSVVGIYVLHINNKDCNIYTWKLIN